MIVYGANPVFEALRAHPKRVRYIGITREQSGRMQKLLGEAKKHGITVRTLTTNEIDRLTGRGVHNGVVADVDAGTYADFHDVIDAEATKFVLILDGITDPQNFGAILRVADGFGVDLVVIPEHDSVGLTPAAIKASAGASEWVSVAQVTNLARSIEALKEKGYWVYAAAADGDRADAIDFSGKVAMVMG
ncbi:MAG: TrmH family RNA methyltransferase, partial [Thermoanaerobaculia bacterium]